MVLGKGLHAHGCPGKSPYLHGDHQHIQAGHDRTRNQEAANAQLVVGLCHRDCILEGAVEDLEQNRPLLVVVAANQVELGKGCYCNRSAIHETAYRELQDTDLMTRS